MNTIFENSAPLTALTLLAMVFLFYYAIYRSHNRDKQLALTPFGHEVDRSKVYRTPVPIYVIKAVVKVNSRTCKSVTGDGVFNINCVCQEKAMYTVFGHTIFPGYCSCPDAGSANKWLETEPYKIKKAVPAIFKIPAGSVVCRKKYGDSEIIISSNIVFISYV